MSPESYRESAFLDHRTIPAEAGEARVPVSLLMDAYEVQRPRHTAPMFIAHTALCGSTLLTRCLDIPGACMPYREPWLFHNLSGLWRLGLQGKLRDRIGRRQPPILDLAIALAARTYDRDAKAVVKLSDSCTSLLPSILDRSPGSRILLLYHALPRFLVAMLRFPYRRQFVHNMRIRAEADLRAAGRPDVIPDGDLSDGRCAALVWLGLMYPYLRILAAEPGRTRSLDAAAFLAAPGETLGRLDAFFDLGIGAERLRQAIEHGAMAKDAKDAGKGFDEAGRQADLESAAKEFGDEIDDAVSWAKRVSAIEEIPGELPNPL